MASLGNQINLFLVLEMLQLFSETMSIIPLFSKNLCRLVYNLLLKAFCPIQSSMDKYSKRGGGNVSFSSLSLFKQMKHLFLVDVKKRKFLYALWYWQAVDRASPFLISHQSRSLWDLPSCDWFVQNKGTAWSLPESP